MELSPEMKFLIAGLKLSGLSIEETQGVCLLLLGHPEEIDELTLFIAENKPTGQEILRKALELLGLLNKG